MSKTDILEKIYDIKESLQKLLIKELDFEEKDYLELSKTIDNLYIKKYHKKNFDEILEDTKKKIDNLQFSKYFEEDKKDDFNYHLDIVKELCDTVNIDYKDSNDDELFDLLVKPETVTMFKHRLFENIKLRINEEAQEKCKTDEDYLNGYCFERCREALINYLCDNFEDHYIFSYNICDFLMNRGMEFERDTLSEIYYTY